MPTALIYLGIMLAVICVWFILLKRPVYESVLVSFAVLLTVTGHWGDVWSYIMDGFSTNLLYTMTAFVLMSIVLTKTKIVDGCVAIILSLLGRVTGGAGYVSVVASAFMGALSGSGPGNVMATGALTIPAMIKSGFPRELAANVESNASYLGNMIPPSSNIVAAITAYAGYAAATGSDPISDGQFWTVMWGLSLWFVVQRIVMVWVFCKHYKVKPMAKEDLPNLKQVFKENWQGLLLPVVILLPFVLDADWALKGFFVQQLGEQGAKFFSSSMLLFIPGISVLFTCLIVKDKSLIKPHNIATMFGNGIKSVAPAVGVCLFGYMIGSLFEDLQVAEQLTAFITAANFSKIGMVLFICILTCFLGMVIPGSSLVVVFGPCFIATLATVGVNPVLAAAMLPCICGVMCGITPPLALGMYAGMSLAGSEFGKTVKNDLWWVAAHFALEVVVLMGWIPILGL